MKITKWVDFPSQEIEIDIGSEDVIEALLDVGDDMLKAEAVYRAVNNLANVFRKLPDEAIALLTAPARGTIGNFLAEQEKRFR